MNISFLTALPSIRDWFQCYFQPEWVCQKEGQPEKSFPPFSAVSTMHIQQSSLLIVISPHLNTHSLSSIVQSGGPFRITLKDIAPQKMLPQLSSWCNSNLRMVCYLSSISSAWQFPDHTPSLNQSTSCHVSRFELWKCDTKWGHRASQVPTSPRCSCGNAANTHASLTHQEGWDFGRDRKKEWDSQNRTWIGQWAE